MAFSVAFRGMKASRLTVIVAAVAMTGACGGAPGVAAQRVADTESPHSPAIDAFLDATLPKGPGGTVVAARDGRLVHCAGFGLADREKAVPAGCDTAYDIMSITKQFTAAAIMKLEMAGRLRVTDPISTLLGPVPPDKRGITVHHLLTHTSGLDDEQGGDDYEKVSRGRMLSVALKSRLQSTPGAEFHYSNLGYSVLAAIVEKVSGAGYERFLARELFAPSGMRQTGYVLPRWRPGQIAVEYDEQGEPRGRPNEHPWAPDGPYWFLRGNGGIISTPRDMFRWHRALEGDSILSADAKAKMFKPYAYVGVLNGGKYYYGYGWGITDTSAGTAIEHTGGNDWSFGDFARFPRRKTMVFWITNHVQREGKWNLEDLDAELTLGVERRASG
ncbi:serine hydrolase [Actinomadura sp. NEAU-AAG7]|uniref:serine hydrolase domain-containing protein n=1 Tax=Actinomadura sp. NEAU-AAG7 TaxID=2839640 RepID=UPI001BE4A752|nr:serine hydrolase domain-containing protein [Actinomadura sp. NEAU-AAG7]